MEGGRSGKSAGKRSYILIGSYGRQLGVSGRAVRLRARAAIDQEFLGPSTTK
jgi:hypothetical protein